MPFESKRQARKFRAMEARGEVPKGTSHRWSHETPGGVRNLPERKGRKGKRARKRKHNRKMSRSGRNRR